MAIYRLEAQIIGRKAKDRSRQPIPGREVSMLAKAAYRSGEKLKDERIDKTFNYASRSQEVVHSEIVAPEDSPGWLQGASSRDMRERLWNTVERVEKRKDSQLAREFLPALPVELSREGQIELVRDWCRAEFAGKGFVADFSIHQSKDGKNPHAHILVTTRPVDPDAPDGFGKKPDTAGKFNGRGSVGKGAKTDLDLWRESWEKQVNAALERAGEEARVDRRSLKERKIDREPEPKIGVHAQAMKKRGKEVDPERVRLARQVKVENQVRSAIRDVTERGEVFQHGAGSTWWERAQVAIGRFRERAGEFWRSEWSSRQAKEQEDRDKEPDRSR